ncbi:MAG: hypothetical protein D6766_04225 [Verrucomicrobia bacterium]|nr:MAG: hypothetical protein D6766_04225 [Verrucomicrobiota bacterium]
MRRQRLDRIIRLHLLLFLNGAGGFAGQLIWVRRLGWGLGAELPSVLAITSAVLAGLALGAWLPDRRAFIRRHPVPTYVAANLLAAVWLPASGLWLADWSARAGGWLGASPSFPAQWAVSFLGALGVLLPALLGLGLALPAMEAVMTRLDAAGRWAASLYAAQTGGALVGLLGGGLWAAARWGDLPTLGAAGGGLGGFGRRAGAGRAACPNRAAGCA